MWVESGGGGYTSSSSGALDSLAAVLKTLGVNDTEMEPDDLGSGTGLDSNISFFFPFDGNGKDKSRSFIIISKPAKTNFKPIFSPQGLDIGRKTVAIEGFVLTYSLESLELV